MSAPIIRPTVETDLPALLEIYNHEILTGTATFDTAPKDLNAFQAWLSAHTGNHPLLTAELDGHAVGYASLSPFSEKAAYAGTVELSVYISPSHRGKGIASALLTSLLALARADERTRLVVSLITSDNAASIRMHGKFGFRFVGRLHGCGVKFGRVLDVDYYELAV